MMNWILSLILIIALAQCRSWNSPTYVGLRIRDDDINIVMGDFSCNEKPGGNLRLHIRSPDYVGEDIVNSYTTETGLFSLAIPTIIPIKGPVTLEVRHVCPVDNVPPEDDCAVPYYLASIPIPWPPTREYSVRINLARDVQNTTAYCL